MSSSPIKIPQKVIHTTLDILHKAAQREHEGIVLWLAESRGGIRIVVEAYEPQHEADSDYFHIPRKGMEALLSYLSVRRLMVAAQVHTHPFEAFHSLADDTWAVIRHVGALSLVLPYFARGIEPSTFVQHAAVFSLDSCNCWREVAPDEVSSYYGIMS